jgi:membrane-associated phospholipid phosphatase
MRLWIVSVMLVILLPIEQCSAQTDSQRPSLAPDAKTESRDSSIPVTRSVKPHENSPTFLPAGEDPENRLFTPFMKHLAFDQKQFWTAPFHMDRQGAEVFLPFVGFTGGLIAGDAWISRQVPSSTSQINRSVNISDYATYSLIGAAGASYFWGNFVHNDHLRETGFLAGEAALNSTAVAYLFKTISQRPRPLEDHGNGTFFYGGASFPSEHSAIAWSVASVIAHEYPGTLTKIAVYGLASAVTLTRVTGKQHFSSDVVVGSALGWYFARQIYRAHHDPELGGEGWGRFDEGSDNGEKVRNPANMGSPYMPLDSWVYPALERLTALGHVQTAYLGMRPWTRMQIAQLLEEANENMQDSDAEEDNAAQKLVVALRSEFVDESRRLDGDTNLGVTLDSVYTRFTGISGTPLRDGYHFGQTLINDYGRPYSHGFNDVTGISTHAVAGPFSFYVRGEYQHAPSAPGLPDQAGQVISAVDHVPAPPPGALVPTTDRMDLLEGYVGIQLKDWQLTFGKQELWWGADASGPMMFSTNAPPIMMLQLTRVKPITLPGIFGRIGSMRTQYILGRLTGDQWVYTQALGTTGSWTKPLSDQPFITGEKISFKPTSNLELGFSATTIFAGTGMPFNAHSLLRAMFSTATPGPGTPTDPGDRQGAFDFAYRIPKLRNWLTFYGDAYTEDQANPWFAWDKSAITSGIYMPRVPKIPKLDLRVEGAYTDLPSGTATISDQPGFFYYNLRYRSGYTNNGNLLGSWVGRQGQGAEAWSNYWFSPKNKLQLHFRHQKVDHKFIPGGGTLTNLGASADLCVRSMVDISSKVQYERWNFPVIAPAPQTNVTVQFQITFHPHWTLR